MKHKILKYCLCLILTSLTLTCLSGCQLIYGRLFVETKDINGEEDTSLAVFTDEDICTETTENFCFSYLVEATGEKSFAEKDYLWDGDNVSAIAATKCSGKVIVQLTYGKTDVIKFTVDPKLTQGNLRIVLLDQEYNILHDFSTHQKSSFEVSDAKGKEFEIRAIGESALFEIIAQREFK